MNYYSKGDQATGKTALLQMYVTNGQNFAKDYIMVSNLFCNNPLKSKKRPKEQKFPPKLFPSRTKIRMLSYSFSISGVRSYIVASYQNWYSIFFKNKKKSILGQRRKFNYAGIRQHQPGKLPKPRRMVRNHQKGKPK